jgi:hypothetical protein
LYAHMNNKRKKKYLTFCLEIWAFWGDTLYPDFPRKLSI